MFDGRIRILQLSQPQALKAVMQGIKVDRYGIDIMLPKACGCLLMINPVSNITANILKQEMLSLGGDAAVSRDSLTGRSRKTGCLLIGNLSQFNRLIQKLKLQPFGMADIAREISCALKNCGRDDFILEMPGHKLHLRSGHCYIMGVINLTPDSFSGDGFYKSSVVPLAVLGAGSRQSSGILGYAQKLVQEGADIIDVGGESSRPGAKTVPLKEELRRVIPAIKMLAGKIKKPISIDTCKPQVARAALDNGASIVNDITGLRNPQMRRIVARYNAAAVIMHMKGNPRTMQRNPRYLCVVDEVLEYFKGAIKRSLDAGIGANSIVIDPGLGFSKTTGHNLELLKNLSDFKVLGRPVLVGPSRKSFIGKVLAAGIADRVFGTAAACVSAAASGAKIVRVHDVKQVRQALGIWQAVNGCGYGGD